MSGRVSVSRGEARRIALAAQGFDRERPRFATDVRHFRRAMAAIAVLQLDFVNVLMPAHFLMIWSRLGPYDRSRFERYLYDSGEHTEQWAHEASVVASSDWPLLAHRRRDFRPWKSSALKQMPDRQTYLDGVLQVVRDDGATTASQLPPIAGPKRKPGDWHRSVPRCALEHHFGTGSLAVRRRLKNFQREYDLPERIIDTCHCSSTVLREDAERELLRKASASLGVATAHDLADYYRMTVRDAAPRIDELVEEGALLEVSVDGWSSPAYLESSCKSPRKISGASLLSPFDPVVWFRPRAKRLFDFDYRIEIYVPAAKRRWGYYVLPFRQGDAISARVDLKADRKESVLRVQSAHLEASAEQSSTAASLAKELRELAAWLNLGRLEVRRANAFEKALAPLLRTQS
jgi:uncharacterized protein YcaQ